MVDLGGIGKQSFITRLYLCYALHPEMAHFQFVTKILKLQTVYPHKMFYMLGIFIYSEVFLESFNEFERFVLKIF